MKGREAGGQGVPCSAQEIMDSREKRAMRQRTLFSTHHDACLISFTLNIPGPVKALPLYSQIHSEGMERLGRLFSKALVMSQRLLLPTGDEGYLVLRGDGAEIKKTAVALEEGHPLGRIFDIDVRDSGGAQIGRENLGLSPRGCLICGREARFCAREQSHPLPELLMAIEQMSDNYFHPPAAAGVSIAERLGQFATAAILHELAASPKPGLVDMKGAGAHKDMNFYTFISSAAALSPHFTKLAMAGFENALLSPAKLFIRLREMGLAAEGEMFSFTRGINTHKGAVFTIGLLAAASAYATGRYGIARPGFDTVSRIVQDMTSGICRAELTKTSSSLSKGQKIFQLHAAPGIRQEAETGYPTIREFSLPVMRRLFHEGQYSIAPVMVYTLITLMSVTEDTNLLSRGGADALSLVKERASALLERHTQPDASFIAEVEKLDEELTGLGLSPGGSADLLAASLFLFMAEEPDPFMAIRYI